MRGDCRSQTTAGVFTGLAHPDHTAPIAYDRARVIGGCSAHNGCVALAGHRRDYDAWAELGNPGWDWAGVAPAFHRARAALQVRLVDPDDVSPFHAAFADACETAGLPLQTQLDNPDGVAEVGFSPVNIRDGVRWNAAFAYLDPARSRANLQILGETLVDRVEVAGGRAVAAHVIRAGVGSRIQASRIVLCGGAYGSPAVLLRSGIGPPEPLRALGIRPIHPLAGVGQALQDHPSVSLTVSGTPGLAEAMRAFEREHWLPDEQALAKARSHLCGEAFDLHLFSFCPAVPDGTDWDYQVWVACLEPRSSGSVTLVSADPAVSPRIDHGFLSDPDGHDLAVLQDGLELARDIISGGHLGHLEMDGDGDAWLSRLGIYFHPACSCRMGPVQRPARGGELGRRSSRLAGPVRV